MKKIIHAPALLLGVGIFAATLLLGCGASLENSHLEMESQTDAPGMAKPFTTKTRVDGNASLLSVGVPMGGGGVGAYGMGAYGYGGFDGRPVVPTMPIMSMVAVDYAGPATAMPVVAAGTPGAASTASAPDPRVAKLVYNQRSQNDALKLMLPVTEAYCKDVLDPDMADMYVKSQKKACKNLTGKENE